jgi:HB1, ASXL, restriction endonuclease HTH domain
MTSGDTTPTSPGRPSRSSHWRRLQEQYSAYPSSGSRGDGRHEANGTTYYEAALRILRSAGRPLTTREITESAVSSGLIAPTSKTPQASMARVLYLRVRTDPELVRVVEPGIADANRNPVRWTLR